MVSKQELGFDMDQFARFEKERVTPLVERLMADDPDMPYLNAYIVAKDLARVDEAVAEVQAGEPWFHTVNLLGSYARMEAVKRLLQAGSIRAQDVYQHLPELWRGSDPDDTDTFYWNLWLDAREWNKREPLTDGTPLPITAEGTLLVWRGQISDDFVGNGIAWSLDKEVAEKFALTGGGRMPRKGGKVLYGTVHKLDVLGYLTQRGEQEVVVLPYNVK